jgi:hypothetical protein
MIGIQKMFDIGMILPQAGQIFAECGLGEGRKRNDLFVTDVLKIDRDLAVGKMDVIQNIDKDFTPDGFFGAENYIIRGNFLEIRINNT